MLAPVSELQKSYCGRPNVIARSDPLCTKEGKQVTTKQFCKELHKQIFGIHKQQVNASEIESLKSQVNKLMGDFQIVSAERDALRNSCSSNATNTDKRLQNELNRLRGEHATREKELMSKLQQYSKEKDLYGKCRGQLNDCISRENTLKLQIAQKQASIKESAANVQKKRMSMKKHEKHISKIRLDHQTALNSAQKDAKQLNSQLQKCNQNMQSIKNDLLKQRHSIVVKQLKLKQLNDRLTKKSVKSAAKNVHIKSLHNKIHLLEQTIADLNERHAQKIQSMDKYEGKKLNACINEVKRLETMLHQKESEFFMVLQQLKAKRKQEIIKVTHASSASLKNCVAQEKELELHIGNLQKKLHISESAYSRAAHEVSQLKLTIQQLHSENDTLIKHRQTDFKKIKQLENKLQEENNKLLNVIMDLDIATKVYRKDQQIMNELKEELRDMKSKEGKLVKMKNDLQNCKIQRDAITAAVDALGMPSQLKQKFDSMVTENRIAITNYKKENKK